MDAALERGKSDLSALDTLAKGRAQIVYGSYTGNGAKTRTLTFPFMPVLVFLSPDAAANRFAILLRGMSGTNTADSQTNTAIATTWLSNGVKLTPLFNDSVITDWNYLNATYFYAAIG